MIRFVLLLVLWTTPFAILAEEIHRKNWMQHPSILEIRKLYDTIEKEIREKRLSAQKKTFEPDSPILKTIYKKNRNQIRKYVEEAGSEDSNLIASYYYDDRNVLRFIFAEGGAVNGSLMEHRVYFDSQGKKIWEIQKYVKGPGYTFPSEWPEEKIIRDPSGNFEK
ncbi:hypothetical protein [Leptospira barantonii]|uniref:Nuclear transport factor 2 family protein n=1 Tax=Leptospira barantonii TaxID=2023184 RepID=A0ABX4NLA0_9LEPT|nr:hypothetical protein [Leptospira barantonii]PJZ57598.1 hypothetical protein CH367_09690 [Leptospira barantonii]